MSDMRKVFEGELSKPLAMAAFGNPHLCITQVGGSLLVDAEGLSMDVLFDYMKDKARRDKAFRAALTDKIIDLSEAL